MPYAITITEVADRQLRSFTARERKIIGEGIFARLIDKPSFPTRAIKELRPNPFAQFELRLGEFRVLYNVEEAVVVVLLIGRKRGNALIVEGTEFRGHQDDPAE